MGYLVIQFKVGQRFYIGKGIDIIVSDVHGGRVDLAIRAPKEYEIVKLPTLQEETENARYPNRRKPK